VTILRRLRSESGVAIPVTLAVLFVVAGLASVAAKAAIVSSNQSFRNSNVKRAVQAAASGLQVVIYQMNLMQPAGDQCVHKGAGDALENGPVQGDGWCAPQVEDLGDNAGYGVQVSSATSVTESGQQYARRTIVSTGTVNGVSRRGVVSVNAATGAPIFPADYAIVGRDSVEFKNNLDVQGGLGSNGDVTIKNNATICGPVTPGPGQHFNQGNNNTFCGYTPAPAMQPFAFQPVDLSTVSTTNDNFRLTYMKNGSGMPQDTCTSCDQIGWNETTRVLTLDGDATLTLSGDNYLFCRLELRNGNSRLQIAARSTTLKVYMDVPENCPGISGAGGADLSGRVINLNTNPATFALMVSGSSTIPTAIELADGAVTAIDAPMAIYAPNSTVDFKNNLDFKGSMVVKAIKVKNNAAIAYDTRIGDISSGSSIRHYDYGTGSYRECTNAPTGATADSGC
jgi:type II secretory pathway pseudopilin PulG